MADRLQAGSSLPAGIRADRSRFRPRTDRLGACWTGGPTGISRLHSVADRLRAGRFLPGGIRADRSRLRPPAGRLGACGTGGPRGIPRLHSVVDRLRATHRGLCRTDD
ncbi:MAG: hypothetical protein VYC95_01705, partial [Verrucomicrobiota bacterium]|nr:hypothetical protein [Verrucomicrobiota bacterium]